MSNENIIFVRSLVNRSTYIPAKALRISSLIYLIIEIEDDDHELFEFIKYDLVKCKKIIFSKGSHGYPDETGLLACELIKSHLLPEDINKSSFNFNINNEEILQYENFEYKSNHLTHTIVDDFKDPGWVPVMIPLSTGSFEIQNEIHNFESKMSEITNKKIHILNKFSISKYPISLDEWLYCIGDSEMRFQNVKQQEKNKPIININWFDANKFIDLLNEKLGINSNDPTRYRLPSEAEWIYAYQTKNLFFYDRIFNNCPRATDGVTGCFWEWVQDNYNKHGCPSNGKAWEDDSIYRVMRGHSFLSDSENLVPAIRSKVDASNGSALYSFRIARTLPV